MGSCGSLPSHPTPGRFDVGDFESDKVGRWKMLRKSTRWYNRTSWSRSARNTWNTPRVGRSGEEILGYLSCGRCEETSLGTTGEDQSRVQSDLRAAAGGAGAISPVRVALVGEVLECRRVHRRSGSNATVAEMGMESWTLRRLTMWESILGCVRVGVGV